MRILEVGGGHGQLTARLLADGHRVVVHGSTPPALSSVRTGTRDAYADRLDLIVSDLWALPCQDRSFDLVAGIRLLAHVEKWRELLGEMIRVSRRFVLVDYPPLKSPNVLTPLLFGIKKRIEGDTRPYVSYRSRRIESHLRSLGFEPRSVVRQFAVPLGIHRALNRVEMSRTVEGGLRSIGWTRWFGSPALLLAERRDDRDAGAGICDHR